MYVTGRYKSGLFERENRFPWPCRFLFAVHIYDHSTSPIQETIVIYSNRLLNRIIK